MESAIENTISYLSLHLGVSREHLLAAFAPVLGAIISLLAALSAYRQARVAKDQVRQMIITNDEIRKTRLQSARPHLSPDHEIRMIIYVALESGKLPIFGYTYDRDVKPIITGKEIPSFKLVNSGLASALDVRIIWQTLLPTNFLERIKENEELIREFFKRGGRSIDLSDMQNRIVIKDNRIKKGGDLDTVDLMLSDIFVITDEKESTSTQKFPFCHPNQSIALKIALNTLYAHGILAVIDASENSTIFANMSSQRDDKVFLYYRSLSGEELNNQILCEIGPRFVSIRNRERPVGLNDEWTEAQFILTLTLRT